MLLDRGLVLRDGDQYFAADEVGSLEVPETLHALIAARLDDLEPTERRVIDDAAVLGKTFTMPGLAALTGRSEEELEPALASLVRKDLLTVQSDPRSPERGNYGFLQALVQRIAHDTLSRKEQKARHLAAAKHLEQNWGAEETEIVEVIASHYLDAYRADPAASDAGEIRTAAREALARAGRRAASLAAHEQAQRYFEEAAELADEPSLEAELLEQAGIAADDDRRAGEAIVLLERAIELWRSEALTHPAARGEARLAMACFNHGQVDVATERMGRSFEVLSRDEPDADLAMLAAQLARFRFLLDDLDGALEPLDFALEIAEALVLPDALSDALNTKGLIAAQRGRREEALGLMRHAVAIAVENDLGESALRAYFNLAFLTAGRDRMEDATAIDEQGRALAVRRGNRQWEESFVGHLRANQFFLGEWDELAPLTDELGERSWDDLIWSVRLDFTSVVVPVHVARGQLDDARRILAHAPSEQRAELQERSSIALGRAALARGEGRYEEALELIEEAWSLRGSVGPDHPNFKAAIAGGLESAVALGDFSRLESIFEQLRSLPPGMRAPFIDAQLARYDAHGAVRAEDPEKAEQRFRHAGAVLREIGARFWLAVVLLEHCERLLASGRNDAELLVEAREIFDELGARPWVERADALAPTPV
jgi:tetratricopeptide (TPR) repeat protein